jgi:hypothetical protein
MGKLVQQHGKGCFIVGHRGEDRPRPQEGDKSKPVKEREYIAQFEDQGDKLYVQDQGIVPFDPGNPRFQRKADLPPFITGPNAETWAGFDKPAGDAVAFRQGNIQGSGEIGDDVVMAFQVKEKAPGPVRRVQGKEAGGKEDQKKKTKLITGA